MSEELTAAQMLEQMKAMMAGQQQPQVQQVPQQQVQPAMPQMAQPMQPMGMFPGAQQPMGMPGQMGMPGPMAMVPGVGPQPTGVGVPVKLPLPDGREMTVRVEFGPEWAGRLQELGAVVLQMFGPYLSAWYPKNQGGYGGGGGYGNGGGGYGGYGGRGRRW